jgi:hypothetical protein
MQHLKVRDVEELWRARILGNARNKHGQQGRDNARKHQSER